MWNMVYPLRKSNKMGESLIGSLRSWRIRQNGGVADSTAKAGNSLISIITFYTLTGIYKTFHQSSFSPFKIRWTLHVFVRVLHFSLFKHVINCYKLNSKMICIFSLISFAALNFTIPSDLEQIVYSPLYNQCLIGYLYWNIKSLDYLFFTS